MVVGQKEIGRHQEPGTAPSRRGSSPKIGDTAAVNDKTAHGPAALGENAENPSRRQFQDANGRFHATKAGVSTAESPLGQILAPPLQHPGKIIDLGTAFQIAESARIAPIGKE